MSPVSQRFRWFGAIAAGGTVRAVAVGVLSPFAFILAEWLFFVSKASALSDEPWAARAQALLVAPLPLMLAGAFLVPLLHWPARRARARALRIALAALAVAFPALCIAAMLFLMWENFTYTLFAFNVLNAPGVVRYAYAAGLVAAAAWAGWRVWSWIEIPVPARRGAWTAWGAFALLTASMVVTALEALPRAESAQAIPAFAPPRRPNILIIGGDGINARNMSAYGYARATTPFIADWAGGAAVFEFAFTNSSATTGAIATLLTGKLPTTTGVIFGPDMLRGRHAREHLPALMRSAGYTNGDFGVRSFADAYSLNLRDGFDATFGGRYEYLEAIPSRLGNSTLFDGAGYRLLFESLERFVSRAGHAFGLLDQKNPIEEVRAATFRDEDAQRLTALTQFIEGAPEPFFAHAHFMGTHGNLFDPSERVFSANRPKRRWYLDAYDDAILDFDGTFAAIVNLLKRAGKYDNTIIVLYSDHGMKHSSMAPVPLMFRFPGEAHAGRRRGVAQLADVAPTLLDYLGARPEPWMDGRSILMQDRPQNEGHLSAQKSRERVLRPDRRFRRIGSVAWTVCQRQYKLFLKGGGMQTRDLPGHEAACGEDVLPDKRDARALLIAHLRERGWDVSKLVR